MTADDLKRHIRRLKEENRIVLHLREVYYEMHFLGMVKKLKLMGPVVIEKAHSKDFYVVNINKGDSFVRICEHYNRVCEIINKIYEEDIPERITYEEDLWVVGMGD